MSEANSPLPARDDASIQRVVDTLAPLLGLTIDPAWRDSVVSNLKVTAGLADLVLAFPLDDEAEPAPVFRP